MAWYDTPEAHSNADGQEAGLRFACTMCGNCCTGPSGYVLLTEDEGRAIAAKLGLSQEAFIAQYTHETMLGRSLNEKESAFGLDCVFLDREKVPGKAVCGIYEARPSQCRTWPFWPAIVRSPQTWVRAAKTCPGINTGPLHSPAFIRLTVEATTGGSDGGPAR